MDRLGILEGVAEKGVGHTNPFCGPVPSLVYVWEENGNEDGEDVSHARLH